MEMISAEPIIRKTSWKSVPPQLLVMAILIYLFYLLSRSLFAGFYFGAIAYLIISNVLERGLAHNHRRGMRLTKSGDFSGAIEEYKKSYDFFDRFSWLDKYRYLTLLSSSKFSYTEMALINMGFCYVKCGNVDAALECYRKTLERFPDNEIARKVLN